MGGWVDMWIDEWFDGWNAGQIHSYCVDKLICKGGP